MLKKSTVCRNRSPAALLTAQRPYLHDSPLDKLRTAVCWHSMEKTGSKSSPIPGERAFLKDLRAQLASSGQLDRTRLDRARLDRARSGLRLGLGDDCAVLRPPPGHEVLVTTDFSLETVHFRREWHTPESIGHRCLARGLSDLAAMGAQPLAAFLSLALPLELTQSRRRQPAWRERFFKGFLALAGKYRVPLAGGDTAQSPRLTLPSKSTGLAFADIVLVGSAPRNRALLRSGAKAGDRIYVTGHLGGAAAELAQLVASPLRFLKCTSSVAGNPNPHPHLFPEPRLAVGAWLLKNRRVTAVIDISDGLSTDLDHLCEESALAAMVDASSVPIHPLALAPNKHRSQKPLDLALHGGEDYELLFTAPPHVKIPRRIAGVPIACIGEMRRYSSRAPRMLLREHDGEQPLHAAGWEHYR